MKTFNLIALMLAAMFLFSVKTSVAQNSTFKLSDYKNPNYLYQSLDLNFGLNNGLSGTKNEGNRSSSSNSFSLNSQAGAVYNRYVNSLKAQGDLYISFNGNIGIIKQKSNNSYDTYSFGNNRKTSDHNERFSFEGVHRFYNQKQNFIEVNGGLLVSDRATAYSEESYSTGNATTSRETKTKYFDNSIRGSFLIGKGRIEQVQDARMALYVLDDLYKLNREKRAVSDEDVNELAQLITRLKYKRFFDTRLRKIAEITAIDSFMQLKGIVSATDATYFTSLNDNWEYANNPIRESGHRLFAGLEAKFGYNFRNENIQNKISDELIRETTNKNKQAELNLVLGYTYENPRSRKWQNSTNIKGSIGMRQYFQNLIDRNGSNPETETDLYLQTVPALNLSGDYGFGYYPTSRTWLTFSWRLNTGWDKKMAGTSKEEKEDSQNYFYASTGPQVYAYYYLSEKLRLSFSYNGQFYLDNYKYTFDIPEGSVDKDTRKYWYQYVNASLTYSLF